MAENTIDKRFIEAIIALEANNPKLTRKEIASTLEIKPQSLTEIMSGRQGVKVEHIQNICAYFHVSYRYIFEGVGEIINTKSTDTPQQFGQSQPYMINAGTTPYMVNEANASLNASPTASPTAKKSGINGKKGDEKEPFVVPQGGVRAPAVIALDQAGQDNIFYIPVKLRAGYLNGYGDPQFMETLPTFRFPGLNNATYRMFEVEGMSMSPTIKPRDRVIGEWVPSFGEIRENRVHIVVTKNDGIVIKRTLNRVQERNVLVLKSDAIENRAEYPNIYVDPSEVLEIWYVHLKVSGDFTEPSELYNRLHDVETNVDELMLLYRQLAENVGLETPKLKLTEGRKRKKTDN